MDNIQFSGYSYPRSTLPKEPLYENVGGTHLGTKTEVLPSHISLSKDANFKEKVKDMSDQIERTRENLEEEFFNLVDYVKENVKKEMNIATQEGNREHNRYTNIGSNMFQTTFYDKIIMFQLLLMTITFV